ncbi:dehydrase and lipid transport-domain-containing protein [Cytidiella melzeri]|nr:dehydrase and lipid transport-domain-containing protein [Cytidiella melzeri]
MLSLVPATVAHSTRHAARQCVQSRTLFSLPDLSSLSPLSGAGGSNSSQDPQTYHERKILPYKQSELYGIVTDVASYPKFLPFCTSGRVVSNSSFVAADGRPGTKMAAELAVGFMSFTESYTSDVTCIPHTSVEAVASSSTTLFQSLSTAWRFHPASAHSPHPTQGAPLSGSSQNPTSQPQPLASAAEATDAGPTLVTLDLSFSFSNPIHASISAAFFGQVSRMMVSAFEERCLELYGPGRR